MTIGGCIATLALSDLEQITTENYATAKMAARCRDPIGIGYAWIVGGDQVREHQGFHARCFRNASRILGGGMVRQYASLQVGGIRDIADEPIHR